jgi:acetyl esterase/lipase
MLRTSLAAGLAAVLALTLAPSVASAGSVKVHKGVVYGKARVQAPKAAAFPLLADLYEPAEKSKAKRPVVVLIHGGGFRAQSRRDGGIVRTAKALAAKGVVVASIDYRLMGQEPVPSSRVKRLLAAAPQTPLFTAAVSAVDDTLTATDYLRGSARRLNIDTGRMGVAGASAGAITADHVGYALDDYRIKGPKFRFVGSLWGGILIPAPQRNGETGATMLERGEPALFAVHGDADPTVPVALDDQLVDRAEEQGVRNEYHRIAGASHGFAGSQFFTARVVGNQTPFDRLIVFARSALR